MEGLLSLGIQVIYSLHVMLSSCLEQPASEIFNVLLYFCRLVQELEDINHAEYLKSVCNDETLRKLSTGKVGNMFLLCKDDRFLIKILRKSEIKVPTTLQIYFIKNLSYFRAISIFFLFLINHSM